MNDNASKVSELESRIAKLEQTVTTSQTKALPPEPVVPIPGSQRSSSSGSPKANLSPDHSVLLEDIEETCNDYHSRGCFINIIRQYSEDTIRAALSVTRETLATVSGTNGGAYFQATLRGMLAACAVETAPQPKESRSESGPCVPRPSNPEAFCTQPTKQAAETVTSRQIAATQPASEAEPRESERPDPEALIKGWRFWYQPGDVTRMLNWIKRCVSQCDVHKLWEDFKAEMTHLTEEGLVSEFLDLMAVKVCYGTVT